MSTQEADTTYEKKLSVGKLKRIRLRLLPKTRSYPINPMRQYERDCETVVRAVGKYIQRKGFCPNTAGLAHAHTWNQKATRMYLEDLTEVGYLEVHIGNVWNVTQRGWDFIGVVPIVPIVPPDLCGKTSSISEMRSVLRRLGTPELIAEYEAFARENRESKVSPYDF